jgi:hypothetical protein
VVVDRPLDVVLQLASETVDVVVVDHDYAVASAAIFCWASMGTS